MPTLQFVASLLLLTLLHSVTHAQRLAPPLAEQATISRDEAAGAQTLYSIESLTLDTDFHWRSTEYYSIRINDLQAARDYGRIAITYNHYYTDLELDFANVLTPNGEIKSVKADAMQERSAGGQDFYEDRAQLVFSLPEIVPGSIMEFQYRRKSVNLAMPGLFSSSSAAFWYQPTVGGNGGRIDPVHRASFTVTVPKQLPFTFKQVGPYKPRYKKTRVNDTMTHQWHWQSLPSIALESAMPAIDRIMSRVRVSTSDDWADVDRWTWRLSKDKFADDKQLAVIASTLVEQTATREQKIKAVYAYLQENIRYVFAHLGRGGYEPHHARDVVAQRYGDCKDQTVLAIALLRNLGIDAYPALVITPRNGRPTMDLVALYFNHMMVWIPASENEPSLWMDTTADRALFPGVSNYLLGQSAFIVDGKGGRLTTVDTQLSDNIGTLTMNYFVDQNEHLIVDVTVDTSGVYEQNLRSWWIHDNNRETSLEQMMTTLFPDAKGKVQISSKVINDDNLWQPFVIQSRFDFGIPQGDPSAPLQLGVSALQAFRLFGDVNALPIPKQRKNRWVNKYKEVMTIHATLSGRARELPAVISSGVNLHNDFFTISQSGKQTDNTYTVDIQMDFPALDLTVEQYAKYYQAISTMTNAGQWLVSYIEDSNQQIHDKLTAHIDSNDLQSQLSLARYYLNQGQFEKALQPAKTAVNLDDSNGEAWYLLGVVQGYNAMLDESMDSFNQATSLGYSP